MKRALLIAALNEAGVFGRDVLEKGRYKRIDKSVFNEPWVFTARLSMSVSPVDGAALQI